MTCGQRCEAGLTVISVAPGERCIPAEERAKKPLCAKDRSPLLCLKNKKVARAARQNMQQGEDQKEIRSERSY